MIKIHSLFILFSFALYSGAWGATCSLDTVPSPAVQSYEKNVDTVLEAAKSLAARASCARDGTSGGAQSAGGSKRALDIVQGTNYDIGNYFRSNDFYLDTSDKTLLPSALEHDKYILGIQQKILAMTAEIGARCAGDIVYFSEDVSLGDALYKTKKRTLQEVMNDLYGQSTEVLTFYRDLASNIRNSEYMDESNFTVAPKGFSDDMREFYSAENIQQCHDEDPKKQQIQEEQKKGLTKALKYPQGVSVWKKAFQLLLYGNNVLSQSQEGEPQPLTAHAKKGGLGNSKALLDKLFGGEFGFPGNSQSAQKNERETSKQRAYGGGVQVPSRFGQTSELLNEAKNSGLTASGYQNAFNRSGQLARVVQEQSQSTGKNRASVASEKESNYKPIVPLVSAMEEHIATLETLDNVAGKVCQADRRQAVKIERRSCEMIMADNNGGSAVVDGSV